MSAPASQLSRAWLVVGLLWFVACLNYLDRVMITTMRGSLTEAIPMTDAQFGLLTSVFLWVYGLLSPFAGFLADRFSRSRVILGSLLVWSALTWLTGHAKTFDQLLLARALMGVSEAAYIPAALALIADYHREHTRSLATGVHMTGICTGAGLGGLGGWLAERHTWGYPFVLFGLLGIAYTAVLWFVLRDAPRDTPSPSPSPQPSPVGRERETLSASAGTNAPPKVAFADALVSLFGRRQFLLMLAYWGLLGMTGWAVVGWMPTYLNEHFHLSQGVAGMSATGYLQAATLVGLILGGGWADRWSRTNDRARILVPVVGLCLAAPAVFLVAKTSLLVLAILGLMLYGLGRNFTDANMMPVLCLVADPRYRATGYGVLNLFSCIIGGVAIYAGGVLRDAQVNVNKLFLCAAASLLVCAALMFLVKPPRSTPT